MTTQDVWALLAVYAVIAIAIAVYFALGKRQLSDPRKIVHILVGNFVFVWWAFSESWIMLVGFVIPFAIVLALALVKNTRMSRSVVGDLSQKGHRYGLLIYVISIGVLVACLFGHFTAASIGVVAMTYGDGFGSVIGKRFGKHRTINGKSAEGSLAIFVATFIMASVMLAFYGWLGSAGLYAGPVSGIIPWWGMAACAGIVATAAECFTPGEYDNITISLSTAALMVLLGL